MKKMKYIVAAVLCAASLTSCDDFLTEEARGVESLDTYFSTEEQVENFTVGCYQNLDFNGWWQVQNVWMVQECASDDLWAGNTSQECDFYNITEYRANMAENGELSNFWQYRYKGIMNCNVGVARISASEIDPDVKKRCLAEVRFLRAYYYFDLVRNFGGVPMVTHFAMPDELDGIRRSSLEECYKFIEDELKEAAADLPARSESKLGHATKGSALGILAKAQLYQEKWSECAATCQQIIDSNEYELLSNYGDVWNVNTNNSKEGIFEVQHMFDETYAIGSSLPTITGARNGPGDGWSWFQPTSDLENAFIKAGDTERLRWSIIKCGCEEIAGEKDFDEFIKNNGILDEGQVAEWEEIYGFDASKCYIIRPDQHKSGRIIRKFFVPIEDRPSIYNTDRVPLNFRVLRYADVLLMCAEANNEIGKDELARTYLNKVRNRVGLDNVVTSGSELREAIRLERRLELCFENNRIYDIRRWKTASGERVISTIMGPNGSFVKYNEQMLDIYEANNQIESSAAKGRGFNPAIHLVFPIPMYEIQHSNGSIEQNPGYGQ